MKTPISLITVWFLSSIFSSCEKSDLCSPVSPKNDHAEFRKKDEKNKHLLEVGDHYEGGNIFFLDPSGKHGLIVASKIFDPAAWGCTGTLINAGSNDGEVNTENILQLCNESDIAARICTDFVVREKESKKDKDKKRAEKFDDWFLPSLEEIGKLTNSLHLLKDQVFAQSLGNKTVWTSSEGPAFFQALPFQPENRAWSSDIAMYNTSSGIRYANFPLPIGKSALRNVIAVRKF